MPDIFTKYSQPPFVCSNPGSPVVDELVREVSFDSSGNPSIKYKKVGERNIQQEIDSCNHNISVYDSIERALKGDPLALNAHNRPSWCIPSDAPDIDFTAAPSSIHEATGVQQRANELFASLPSEIKELYGNSPERMVSEFTPESFSAAFEKLINKGDSNSES